MNNRCFDFILGYEHVQRELNSVCAIKDILEELGYSVFVYYIEDRDIINAMPCYHAKVLVLPYLYDDQRVFIDTHRGIKFDKLINLQWEQLFSKGEEDDPSGYKIPSGVFGKYAMHISWGPDNKKRLVEQAHIQEDRIRICGHPAMDFLTKPLSKIYISRDDLLKKYGINPSRRVILFISSYKAAFSEGNILAKEIECYGQWRQEQHDILLRSFKETMNWLSMAMEQNPDDVFIYRPHPGELCKWSDDIVCFMDEIKKRHKGFYIIEDQSVQQWIRAADFICVGGLSTSVAEVYFARKGCCILYPFELPENLKMRLFDGADTIKNSSEFSRALLDDRSFPIPKANLDCYYYDTGGDSCGIIARTMHEVYLKDDFLIPLKEKNNTIRIEENRFWAGHRRIWRFRIVQQIMHNIEKYIGILRIKADHNQGFILNEELSESKSYIKKEIQEIQDQIKKVKKAYVS